METSHALAAFAALSQETRLGALRLLIAAGPGGRSAGAVARGLGVRPNTLSPHLAALERAGLVAAGRSGREIRYAARTETLRALVGWLLEDCCGGRPDLCAPLLAAALPDAAPAAPDTGPLP